ncbi:MAG TPA: ABC transporter permease [Candidatus Saccharimonadales bacterium]|nr:ABC transporter permease [Candidatus Saccharimonadales bacterium]
MLNAIQQALKALLANKGRTFLTTLGIMIGIATVILVLSAGAGFRALINDQIDTYGTNTLYVQTKVPSNNKNRSPRDEISSGITITSFKQRDLDDIKKLPNVVNDYGMVLGQAAAVYRNNHKTSVYIGASAAMFEIDRNKLKSGRFFSAAEDSSGAQVVILGDKIASDLFKQDDPLGKILRIGSLNFQVIGIYEPSGGLGGGNDDYLLIPLNTAQKKMLGINYLLQGVVQIADNNLSDLTSADIASVMRRNHNITDPNKEDFEVMTQAQLMDIINTIFDSITILLIAIAAISLIVGGVGIMNIMYVVVTERTAEIGLRKALGAKNSNILQEFLVEAVIVTIMGGIIGILFGAFLTWVLTTVAVANGLAWNFVLPLYAIGIGFSVSAIIGISFGVLPAVNASKMDPIEALRHE